MRSHGVEWLRQFIQVEHGIPSHDTISRVFVALDSKVFQECFIRWTGTMVPSLAVVCTSLLLVRCQGPSPGCIPLYVTEPSNRSAKIDIRIPGRYCLMTDLHARFDFADHPAEGRKIHIFSSKVELDLMGHTLARGRFFVQPGGIGIDLEEDAENVIIKNGKLENFDIGGLPLSFRLGARGN
jgi:hypothetical protein